MNIPTASDERLGLDSWGAGISAVGLTMQGPLVVGVLVNNVEKPKFGADWSTRFKVQFLFPK